MKTTKIKISGMSCANCATHVQKALKAVPRVKDVNITLEEGATVEHEKASHEQLLRAVCSAADYHGEIAA